MFDVMIREINRLRGNKPFTVLVILLPVLISLLISLIYSKGTIDEIPIGVYDSDRSEISRSIINSLDAISSLNIVRSFNSQDELEKSILKDEVKAALIFEKDFSLELKRGSGANIILIENNSNLIIGNIVYKQVVTVIRTFSGKALVKKLITNGMMKDEAAKFAKGINPQINPLFNTSYDYSRYLVSGLLPFFLQMIIMISAAIIFNSEFKENSCDDLLQVSGRKVSSIIFGKAIPYLFIHSANVFFVFGFLLPAFGIYNSGSVINLILLVMLFVLSSFFVGFSISVFLQDQMLATEVALFVNTPAFIFSGYTFPISAMPEIHSWFANALPFTHFLKGFMKSFLMGGSFNSIKPELLILTIFFAVSVALTSGVLF